MALSQHKGMELVSNHDTKQKIEKQDKERTQFIFLYYSVLCYTLLIYHQWEVEVLSQVC
jgi:hypothetical protein